MKAGQIHLGYEVGTADGVLLSPQHMAVTGQTQQSGKTTTLEAMVARSGATALTFLTKRGEASFEKGRRIKPYFRDRADWQFVTSIIDATLQEKNKFLRPWIMKICRNTKTLKEVQAQVRIALRKAKGINEGVYTQLDAYLDLIVPVVDRADMARTLDLAPGVNVMDVTTFSTPMQMLFIQSALDWVNDHCRNTVVVIPEAWEFVPEGKGSPVKSSAITLVRKGAGIGNYIWLDSQDMAGVDKTLLRGCTTWLIGVQREANEIKRNLANIPASIKRPNASDIATLERGQFFACFGRNIVKTYVQPEWMDDDTAKTIALGDMAPPAMPRKSQPTEGQVDEKEARALRERNAELEDQIRTLTARISQLEEKPPLTAAAQAPVYAPRPQQASSETTPVNGIEAIYAEVKRRAENDPGILRLLASRPEIDVTVERPVIRMDTKNQPGLLALFITEGFFDNPTKPADVVIEIKRRGRAVHNANVYRDLNGLAEKGFLTVEPDGFKAVAGMKVNIKEG